MEFKDCKLGDLITNFDNKRRPISTLVRNKMMKIYPYYGANGIIDYVESYIYDGEYLLIAEDGTVLVDKKYPVIYNVFGKFWVNNHAHVVKAKENLVSNNYLFYVLKLTDISPYITGAVQLKLNQENLNKILISVPSLENQNRIVKILSDIDRKVELNNQIKDNLKKISEGLYKSWFIDFEFSDEESNLYKSFGGKMIESKLGKIPEGWKASTLGEITIRVNERAKSNDVVVLSAINTGELVKSDDFFKKQVYSKNTKNYIVVRKNEFAYNPARINIGSIGINNCDFVGCVSPVYVVFKAKQYYEMYINEFIKTSYFKKEVALRASGSVRQTLNYDDFSLIKLVYPPLKIINEFNSIYKSLYASINKIEENTETLVDLRETLLPKLIGGEINLDSINI